VAPLTGLFEYIATGTPAEGPYTRYSNLGTGVRCLGYGQVDVDYTYNFAEANHHLVINICLNGVSVASVARNDSYSTGSLKALAVDVVSGDEITALVTSDAGQYIYANSQGIDGTFLLVEGTLSGIPPVTVVPLPPPPNAPITDTADPTAADGAPLPVGQTWINTTSGEAFVLVDNTAGAAVWVSTTATGIVYAPTTADYLVGTAQGGLSAEIVVGTTPGGELGGSWASPTVDATHSGSAHHAAVTLAASADELLALTGQALSFDTKAANLVLAGPATGAAAVPTFRALVAADVPAVGVGELVVVDGTTGPTGVIPNSYVEMTTPRTTTSATLVDITGATTTITVQRPSDIAVWMTAHVSADATCDLGLAINVDGTDHDLTDTHLTATDEGNVAIIHRTVSKFAPGTYTVKGRFQRTSGGGTPSVDRADLLVAALTTSGPVLVTTDDETDFVYADLA
jgi:hypothetical protein